MPWSLRSTERQRPFEVDVFVVSQHSRLKNGVIRQFAYRSCIVIVQANVAQCEANVKNSTAFATELVTSIGYEAAAEIVMGGTRRSFPALPGQLLFGSPEDLEGAGWRHPRLYGLN
jgi:hypothetical protein